MRKLIVKSVKEYTKLRQFYAWVGFVVVTAFVLLVAGIVAQYWFYIIFN